MQDQVSTRWLTREDVRLKKVSYAQNHEDVLLDRVFGAGHPGFYVDAGANDPVFHSVTKMLYEGGWRGVNIEPNPVLHGRLVADRPGDASLNVGVSDAEGTLTFFDVPAPLHGWSTFLPDLAAHYRSQGVEPIERAIPVTTLGRIFEQHVGDRTVDVLKVDVEGFERQALSGLDLGRWRPRVLLIESTWPESWEPMILGADYLTAAFDGINRYYVRAEDRALLPALAAPVNILDNFVPYEYLRLLCPVPEAEELGPTVVAVARRLKGIARRNPRVAKVVRRILRRVG